MTCVWMVMTIPARGATDNSASIPGSTSPRMDYGSMLTYTVGFPGPDKETNTNLALKGICIRLGETQEATVCFDTDLLRYYAGWTGGFLDLSRTHLTSSKGSWHALIQGEVMFKTSLGPGWSKTGDFSDPRPIAAGPLPRESGRFKGVYRDGRRVVLNYLVEGTEIFEISDSVTTNGVTFFSRSFHIEKTDAPLTLRVCDVERTQTRGKVVTSATGDFGGIEGETATWVRVAGANGKVIVTQEGAIQVGLPTLAAPADFQVLLWSGPASVATREASRLVGKQAPIKPKELIRGGDARWPEEVLTKGRLGTGPAPYVADNAGLPERNPWNSWMRLVAFDFFPDGRAAVSTWNGDVWIVSGLTEKLERVTWRRYAAGVFEPLGLRIVDGQVFVLCRDQLMRLHDLNGDGEADFYECFSNETWLSPSYHGFAFDLQTDRAGNFYYTRCGQRVDPALPLNGGMVKVAKDGSRAELVASGLRAANGMAIGPKDEMVCSDNQGNWIPSSRLNWIKPGGFYGYLPHARREPAPTDYEKPVCWLPMKIDNSSGGQVWVTGDRWGPFEGQILHTSYGRGSLFLVMMEEVSGIKQGGVVQFPLKFDSGIMRARFNPRDGQLWVCGLRGWQTSGGKDGALQRVRFTGGSVRMPAGLNITSRGVNITFTCAMDEASANDEQNYAAEVWNYRWTEQYGSPEFSVADPRRQAHDPVTIKSARLSSDRKMVSLDIPGIKPVMQMKIQFRLKAADGAAVEHEIYNTINQVPGG
jgi:glucose/arabinose dehydrogenase